LARNSVGHGSFARWTGLAKRIILRLDSPPLKRGKAIVQNSKRRPSSALVVAIVALIFAMTGTGIAAGPPGGSETYRVPSGSMEPTLKMGQVVTITPLTLTPRVGQIVVFHPPAGAPLGLCGAPPRPQEMCSRPSGGESSYEFVKRVVAGPDDKIFMRQGHVYRRAAGSGRFAREKDTYIRNCRLGPNCNFPKPVKIPAGDWFLVGDNRVESEDSRDCGPVPALWIVGVAHP